MPKTAPSSGPRASNALTAVPVPPRPREQADGLGFALDEPEPGRRLVLQGRLGVAVAADVRLALTRAVETGSGELVLDLSQVQQVDATGLGVLVGAHRAAGRAGRALVLQDVPPQVERLLRVTRLHRVIRTARSSSCA